MACAPVQVIAAAPRRFIDRFDIEVECGHGAMGTVYKATDRKTGELVALKVLHDSAGAFADRFNQEATVLAELRHPAVVRYVDHGVTTTGEHYLAMEWLEGDTLEDRLVAGALTIAESLVAAQRALEALTVAHARGIVHRDIKPSNLFLVGGDLRQLKVLDFGIARRLFEGRRITRAGSTLGTPMYMSPEQARGEEDVDARSDLFSLGCVLFECVSGFPPFTGETPMAVLAKICLDDPVQVGKRVPGLPAPVESLLRRLLAKPRTDRPGDTAVLSAEVSALADALHGLGYAEPIPMRTRRTTPSLTPKEHSAFSALMAARPRPADDGAPVMPNFTDTMTFARVEKALKTHNASLTPLYDGSLVVSFDAGGTPADQAVNAARAAREILRFEPQSSLAIATHRIDRRGPLPVDKVFEDAARLLVNQAPGSIRVDGATVQLIESRFDINGDREVGGHLLFEKGIREPPRRVCGRLVPCVGRDRELAQLEALYDECLTESVARSVVVTSAPGGGKSRVRHELVERLHNKGARFEFLLGGAEPTMGPQRVLAQAILGACGLSGLEPLDVQRAGMTSHIGRHAPPDIARRLISFLGEICGVHFSHEGYLPLEAARQDARLMSDQTQRAWVDWLEVEARIAPVVVVIDDIQWADEATVRAIDASLRVLKDLPLFVAAFARPELDARFPRLWDERGVERVSLAPLTSKACQKIARIVLDNLNEERAAFLVDRSDGNAFCLEELLRACAAGFDPATDKLPDTVLGLAQNRFSRVTVEGRRVLRAASIYGMNFRREGLAALLPDDATMDLDTWISILEERELFVEKRSPNGAITMGFRNRLLREAAYDLLIPEDRRNGHRLAADFLEEFGPRDPDALAEHAERGEQPARAAHWCRVGAQESLVSNDLDKVVAFSARAVKNGAAGEELGLTKLAEAEARHWRGENEKGKEAAQVARGLLVGVSQFQAARALAICLFQTSAYGEVDALARSLPNPTSDDERLEHGAVMTAVGFASISAGDHARARECLHIAKEAVCQTQSSSRQVDVLLFECSVDSKAGNYDEVLRKSDAALQAAIGMGDLRLEAVCRANHASWLGDVGMFAESETFAVATMELTGRLDLRSVETLAGLALVRFGTTFVQRSAGPPFETLLDRVLDLAREQGDRRISGCAQIYNAIRLLGASDPTRALAVAEAAQLELAQVPGLLPFAQAVAADCLRRLGNAPLALVRSREAHEMLLKVGALEDGDAHVRLVHALCLLDAGHVREAKEHVIGAADIIGAQSLKIRNAHIRDQFLTAVWAHRETLALKATLALTTDCG